VKTEMYTGRPQCRICNRKTWLNIHHKTYKNYGKEKKEDLMVLCKFCHGELHRNGELQNWMKRWEDKKRHKGKKVTLKEKQRRKAIQKRNYVRNKYKRVNFAKRNRKKNHAGLFTWKANEVENSTL